MINRTKLYKEIDKTLEGEMTWESLKKLDLLFSVCHDLEHYENHEHHESYSHHAHTGKMCMETARKWVACMKNSDGTIGEHWTLEQVKLLMQQKCVMHDPIKLWIAMNAEYSDRSEVNKKYGVNNTDFYLDSAIAFWLEDLDAVNDKEAEYYNHVVKH